MSGGGGSTGRRANRTRFTDFQLRTMQEFFDKQAYPKDDDLEMLSKKLGFNLLIYLN
jgi:AT-binding transcription factor 1